MGTEGLAYLTPLARADHWERVLPDFQKALDEPEAWCIDAQCKDTNWGGWHRLHTRSSDCPSADATYVQYLQAQIADIPRWIAAQREAAKAEAERGPIRTVDLTKIRARLAQRGAQLYAEDTVGALVAEIDRLRGLIATLAEQASSPED